MINNDIRKENIDYYVSLLKESYYNSSYISKILNPLFSKNVPLEKEITTETPIHERDLQSNTKYPDHPIVKEGERIAEEEIDYLLTEVRKRNKIQPLPENLPEELHLLVNYFHLRKQNYLIVPKKLRILMIQNSREWRFENDKETGNSILKLVNPPVIVIPSESITDVICIINSTYGMVDYYSKDGKDKRFIIEYIDIKFNVKIKGWIWLKIDLSSKADNALFKIPDALLEIIET